MRSMRWLMGLALAAAMMTGLAGGAEALGKWTLGGGAGAAVPSGDFGDAFQGGFDGGVFADYWTSDHLALGFELAGSGHDAEDEFNDFLNAFTELVLLSSGATTAESDLEASIGILRIGVRGTLAAATAAPVLPYVQVGFGAYRLNQRVEGTVVVDGIPYAVDEAEDDTKAGLNGAAGVLFQVTPVVALGVQGQIHNVFTEEESTQYFGFSAIVSFVVGGPI